MYKKDRKVFYHLVEMPKDIVRFKGKEVRQLFEEHAEMCLDGAVPSSVIYNYENLSKYKFILTFKKSQDNPDKIDDALTLLVKWAITDARLLYLKDMSLKYRKQSLQYWTDNNNKE